MIVTVIRRRYHRWTDSDRCRSIPESFRCIVNVADRKKVDAMESEENGIEGQQGKDGRKSKVSTRSYSERTKMAKGKRRKFQVDWLT